MPSMEHIGDHVWIKACTRCNTEFKVTAHTWADARELMLQFFHANTLNNRLDEMQSHCKSCGSNKRHRRALDRHRDDMYNEQGGKCGLCSLDVAFDKGTAAIDHCHISGAVRKILCKRCNFLMAGVDDQEWLAKAIAYRDSFKCE